MRQYMAFTKKEFLEQARSGKLVLLAIVFCLFGVMNPAIAKLTPWMMEMLSGQLSEMGMTVTGVEVDALTSWTQFFKNMPIMLLIFLVLFSGILTAEYQRGTLVNVVTKGMKRWKIIFSKMGITGVLWTAGCLLSYSITYGYNAFFWDNSVVCRLFFAVFCFYLFGLWMISVIMLASALSNSSAVVMLTVAAAYLLAYLSGLFPAFQEYSPSRLLSSAGMLTGAKQAEDYFSAVLVTAGLMLVCSLLSVPVFNRRNIMA